MNISSSVPDSASLSVIAIAFPIPPLSENRSHFLGVVVVVVVVEESQNKEASEGRGGV
jgi:hypothetical protein